ncbi:MAG: DUF3710 domain-containing protein [Actinomycetales bacterium]|nr:DUF3710 domain-containing protein [Actinomycetales bacterium]
MSSSTERALGPWDESEADLSDGIERLDLGGLLVAATPGVDLQVQVDESSGRISLLTFATKQGSVQVQPYAAPRSGGMWADVRGQIAGSISASGGLVEEADGSFGTELRAQIKGSDGSLQPARFVGVEGPRWFLRGVFLGQAARPGAQADVLEGMFRSVVVVRGTEAMPMGSPIPLRLPDAPGAAQATAPAAPLSPFERGPEITEIR